MGAHEGLLEIGGKPNPLLHLIAAQQVLTLLDKFISAHLNVFVEQIAAKYLLPVLVVELVANYEQKTKSGFGNELHVLVVEEQVVVIKEKEAGCGGKHKELLVVWVVNIEVGHVIIPFGVVGIQKHGVERELWPDSLNDVEQVKHLLD